MKIMFSFCLQNRIAPNLMFEPPCPLRGTVSGFETHGYGSNLCDVNYKNIFDVNIPFFRVNFIETFS